MHKVRITSKMPQGQKLNLPVVGKMKSFFIPAHHSVEIEVDDVALPQIALARSRGQLVIEMLTGPTRTGGSTGPSKSGRGPNV